MTLGREAPSATMMEYELAQSQAEVLFIEAEALDVG